MNVPVAQPYSATFHAVIFGTPHATHANSTYSRLSTSVITFQLGNKWVQLIIAEPNPTRRPLQTTTLKYLVQPYSGRQTSNFKRDYGPRRNEPLRLIQITRIKRIPTNKMSFERNLAN